jgi:hypothetical protein
MTLDNFRPLVAIEVIGCPVPMIDQALVLSAAEFCRSTLAWTEIQDPVLLLNGMSDYDIDVPTGAYLHVLRDVWVGDRRLEARTMDELQGWRDAKSSEPAFYNMATERGVLTVFPQPFQVTGSSLVMRAAYAPNMGVTSLPDFLGREYLEAVCSGAKARLMLMAGVPWSNPALGGYHRQSFDGAVALARISEMHDRMPGRITVKPRSFGF